jgi:hypothetical protein
VDPYDLAHRLNDAGFKTQVVRPGLYTAGCSRKWTRVVQVTEPGGLGYERHASIFCDHRGMRKLLIVPRLWRKCCANEFDGAEFALHHNSDEIRDFVRDPVPHVRMVMGEVTKLQDFVQYEARRAPASPDLWLEVHKHPRLAKRVEAAVEYYRDEARRFGISGDSAWVQLQALTEVKSPTTVRWAHEYLTGKWPVSQ